MSSQTGVYQAPARSDRIRSGCVGVVLFFPFYLLLLIVVAPLQSLLGEPVTDFALRLDRAPIFYFAFVSVPLTIVFGQSLGQRFWNIYVVRFERSRPEQTRRPGVVTAVLHVVLFVVLFPIDWLPWLFGRTRMLHEMGAGTEVLVSPAPPVVHVTGRGWLTIFGVLYYADTTLFLVVHWGSVDTYVTVLVLWALPLATAIYVMTAERHPPFFAWSVALACILGPWPVVWAVMAGKLQLDFVHSLKLWEVALCLTGLGCKVIYDELRKRAPR